MLMWKERRTSFKVGLAGHVVAVACILVAIFVPRWWIVETDGVIRARGIFESCVLSPPYSCNDTVLKNSPVWFKAVFALFSVMCGAFGLSLLSLIFCSQSSLKLEVLRTGRLIEFSSVLGTIAGVSACCEVSFQTDPRTLGWAYYFAWINLIINALATGLMIAFHRPSPRVRTTTVRARFQANRTSVGIQLPAAEGSYRLPYVGDVDVERDVIRIQGGTVLPPSYESVIEGGGTCTLELIQELVSSTNLSPTSIPPPSYDDVARGSARAGPLATPPSRPRSQHSQRSAARCLFSI